MWLSCCVEGRYVSEEPVVIFFRVDLNVPCLKVPRSRPLFRPIRIVLRWKWVWSIGWVIRGNQSTGRKTCRSATLSTIHQTWTGQFSNAALTSKAWVPASRRTQLVSFRKTNRLMLFKETIVVYCNNYRTHKYAVWTIWRGFLMC
jgi:hypothetical protein